MRLRDLINRKKRENMLALNEFAKNTFASYLIENVEGRAAGYKYLRGRVFHEDTIKTFELGFGLSDRKALTNFALKNGYRQKYLVDTGLSKLDDDYQVFDRFSNCVIFPIHNLKGKVIGFCGRVLNKDTKMLLKYKDSPQSTIYDKHRALYGIYQAQTSIVHNDKCFLVEGCTDVLSLHQSGIENVVASLGTALTIHQIRLIKKFTNNITLFYDGDAAGIHATLRAIDMILAEDMNAKVVPLPDGEDPDSFANKYTESEIKDYITKNETDCLLFKTRLLLDGADNDPIKKANAISNIATSISVIPADIKRTVYAIECAKLIGIDEKVLNNEIDKRQNKLNH